MEGNEAVQSRDSQIRNDGYNLELALLEMGSRFKGPCAGVPKRPDDLIIGTVTMNLRTRELTVVEYRPPITRRKLEGSYAGQTPGNP
jgi:hypothetical protein